jgi:glycosyltransferase involved in cell wall biosynthesis
MDRLVAITGHRSDIKVFDAALGERDYEALLKTFDILLSLHRSEGLGIPLGEAMSLGIPVVATAYGGNMDFMSNENSYLVDCEKVILAETVGPYPAGSVWAEPLLDEAVDQLRRAVFEECERKRKAAVASKTVGEKYTFAQLGTDLEKALQT